MKTLSVTQSEGGFIALVFQESEKEQHQEGIALPQNLISRSGRTPALPYPAYK